MTPQAKAQSMTDYFTRHFLGSLFSIQFVWAYGIAASIMTGAQLLLLFSGRFVMPDTKHELPVIAQIFVETLIPWYIPPITSFNIAVVLLNLFLAILILAVWSSRFDRAMRSRRRW